MMLYALDPTLVMVDFRADKRPLWDLVQHLIKLVEEQLARHLAGVAASFSDGDDG